MPRHALFSHFVFMVWGAGSAWYIVNTSWVELPVYQGRYGLRTANYMQISYNCGTISIPCYLLTRALLFRLGRSINTRALIIGMAIVNASVLIIGILDFDTIGVPIALNVVSGTIASMVDAVHQGHILANYDAAYLASFWAGDNASGIWAAILELIQEPQLGPDGERFGPRTVYICIVPLFVLGLLAFWAIERYGLGGQADGELRESLLSRQASTRSDGMRPMASALSMRPMVSAISVARKSRMFVLRSVKDDIDINPPSPVAVATPSDVAGTQSPSDGAGPQSRAKRSETMASSKSMSTQRSMVPILTMATIPSAKDSIAEEETTGLLPAGIFARPLATVLLVLATWWTNFGMWGVGDALFPFACAESSPEDAGLACVAFSGNSTFVACMAGTMLAGLLSGSRRIQHLVLCAMVIVFTISFAVLCAAAGGFWTSGGTNGLVLVVVLVRFTGTWGATICSMLVQEEYEAKHVDGMNLVLVIASDVANVMGSAVTTAYLAGQDS